MLTKQEVKYLTDALAQEYKSVINSEIYTWMHYLRRNNDLSKSSITSYITIVVDLDFFLSTLYKDRIKSIKDINTDMLLKYLDYCREVKNNNGNTIYRKYSVIKKFLNYYVYNHKIEYNPLLKIPIPSHESKNRVIYVNKEHYKRIIEIARKLNLGERDVFIYKLLYIHGLGVNEVLELNINDIYIDDAGNYCVNVKRTNINVIYLIDETIKAYEDYMHLRNDIKNDKENALFISKNGNRLTRRGLSMRFKKILELADINKNYTPIHLKHSFIVRMKNKVDKSILKELLDQKKLDRYYKNIIEDNNKKFDY